jgi:hypothetical protein
MILPSLRRILSFSNSDAVAIVSVPAVQLPAGELARERWEDDGGLVTAMPLFRRYDTRNGSAGSLYLQNGTSQKSV